MSLNPIDTLANSNFDADKIVAAVEFQLTADTGGDLEITLTHALPFKPLYFIIASKSPDFSDSLSCGYSLVNDIWLQYEEPGGTPGLYITNNPAVVYAGETVYFKLFAFEPFSSAAEVPLDPQFQDYLAQVPIYNIQNDFAMDTRFNFNKIYSRGVGTSGTIVPHDFGYIPQVMVWKNNGIPVDVAGASNDPFTADGPVIELTTSALTITDEEQPEALYEWRLYYDKAV